MKTKTFGDKNRKKAEITISTLNKKLLKNYTFSFLNSYQNVIGQSPNFVNFKRERTLHFYGFFFLSKSSSRKKHRK